MSSISSIAVWVFVVASGLIVVLLAFFQKNRDRGTEKKQNQIRLTPNGNNANISIALKSDQEMRAAGFTDDAGGMWRYHKEIGDDTFFDLAVRKADKDDFTISVFNGEPMRPYDYQKLLLADPRQETALDVRSRVEGEMKYLKDNGIVRGHRYGDYI